MSNSTLIDYVLTDMESKRNIDSTVAKGVQKIKEDVAHYRIGEYYEDLVQQRIDASDKERDTGVRGKDPEVAPEYILTFCQRVMNSIMWKARALDRQITNQEKFDNDTSGGTGQDFGDDLCEVYGIPAVDRKGLAEIVANDFARLQSIHSEIQTDTDEYLDDITPFAYFVENAVDDEGEWSVSATANSYTDAIDLCHKIVDKLKETEQKNRRSRFRKVA